MSNIQLVLNSCLIYFWTSKFVKTEGEMALELSLEGWGRYWQVEKWEQGVILGGILSERT